MTQNKSTDTQNKQSAGGTEDDAAKKRAGVTGKSSHEHMSREKAGKDGGAGGGAKQKQNHK